MGFSRPRCHRASPGQATSSTGARATPAAAAGCWDPCTPSARASRSRRRSPMTLGAAIFGWEKLWKNGGKDGEMLGSWLVYWVSWMGDWCFFLFIRVHLCLFEVCWGWISEYMCMYIYIYFGGLIKLIRKIGIEEIKMKNYVGFK